MAEINVFHDRDGQTLTVWFTDASLEYAISGLISGGIFPGLRRPRQSGETV
jgi:hypothetical protein